MSFKGVGRFSTLPQTDILKSLHGYNNHKLLDNYLFRTMAQYPKESFKYYTPLTTGAPKDGPTTSLFSVPRVQYSPQTAAVVQNLMRESRLSFTQKNIFETILRNGRSLPEYPSQMNSRLRCMQQQRHKNKARLMGMEVMEEPRFDQKQLWSNVSRGYESGACRRSLDTIKASGDLDPILAPKSFIPTNRMSEKDRFAHKMAYGSDMVVKPKAEIKRSENKPSKTDKEIIAILQERRCEDLIDEIQDRMQFLLAMDKANKAKDYNDFIISQINEKLQEMKKISPEKEKDVRDCLQLELLDRRLSFPYEHRTSKLFHM